MDEIDREVLATLSETLGASLVDDVIGEARRMYDASLQPDRQQQLRRDLDAVQREQRQFTDAIAAGGDAMPILLERLQATETKRRELVALLERSRDAARVPAWREVERRLRRSLADWRALFTGDVARAREGFRQLLTTPIRFAPFTERGYRAIRFSGTWGAESVFGGALVTNVASPQGFNFMGAPPLWLEGDVRRAA